MVGSSTVDLDVMLVAESDGGPAIMEKTEITRTITACGVTIRGVQFRSAKAVAVDFGLMKYHYNQQMRFA